MTCLGSRWGGLVLLLAVAWGAGAHAVAAEDDYAAVRETLEICFVCHGKNGASTQPEFPVLAGQHLYYLYVQLKDFKAGRRESPEMTPIAAGLDKEKMRTIAKFFSEQVWPNIGYRADPELAKRGEIATAAGQCVQCHLGGYEGYSRIPHVAGQYAAYLNRTMLVAGGGAKGGSIYGATDELGYGAVEDPLHVHDFNATILHLLGLDHEKLTFRFQGREFRLTDVHGKVRNALLA